MAQVNCAALAQFTCGVGQIQQQVFLAFKMFVNRGLADAGLPVESLALRRADVAKDALLSSEQAARAEAEREAREAADSKVLQALAPVKQTLTDMQSKVSAHVGGVPAELVRTVPGLVRVVEYLDAIRGRV